MPEGNGFPDTNLRPGMLNPEPCSFHLPILIVRSNNIYGPGQYPEKVIPRFICRRLRNLPLQIQGLGTAQRSFIHVSDVVRALDTIYLYGRGDRKNTKAAEIYNIASQDEYTVMQVAEKIQTGVRVVGGANIEKIADRQFQDVRYFINAEKLKRLGWRQVIAFDDGLQNCIEWYSQHYKEFDADA